MTEPYSGERGCLSIVMLEFLGRIYWNYFAIGYIVVGAFTLLAGLFAFTIKDRSRATFHFGMFFLAATALSFAFTYGHFFYDTAAVYHRYFTIIGAMSASVHILQFLIHFPEPSKRKVAWFAWVQWIVIALTVGYFAKVTWSIERTFHFSAQLWDYDAEVLSRNVGFVIIVYALIYVVYGVFKVIFKLKGQPRWVVLAMLIAFISVTLVPGILNVLSREGAIDRNLFVNIFTLLNIVGCFTVVILFINNTSDRTTFMVKITGITLVTVLFIFQILTYFSLKGMDENFDEIHFREGELFLKGQRSDSVQYAYTHRLSASMSQEPIQANEKEKDKNKEKEAVPVSGGVATVDYREHEHEYENTYILYTISGLGRDRFNQELETILSRSPVHFNGYSNLIREYLRNAREASAADVLERIASVQRLVGYRAFKIRQLPDKTFRKDLTEFLKGSGAPFAPFRAAIEEHLALSKAEGAELKAEVLHFVTPAHMPGFRWYRDSADGRTQFVSYIYVAAPGSVTEVGFSYRGYREFMHHNASRAVILLIAALLFVLIGFRVFFSGALLGPLEALLRGVRKVNAGNLDVAVTARVEDEIGFLTHSFNGMVSSIRDARLKLQDYANSLEEKVKARTAELQETLTQVQSLKSQQDGDYFLTALLLRPLRANRAKSDAVSVEFFQRQKKHFTFRHWQEEIGGDLCMSNNLRLNGRPFTVVMNADAMGKSMQGAGGALVLGSVFEAILERTQLSAAMQEQFPERWIKNAFIELHKVFEAFECSMMVSLVIGLIDEESGLLYYINAEHPFSILYRRGKAAFMDVETLFRKLGSPATSGNISIRTFQLQPGDVMIIGSDGRDDILLSEEGREPFMNEDESKILGHVEASDGNLQGIFDRLTSWGTIIDDLTFIRIGYRESGGVPEALIESPVNKEIRDLLVKSGELTRAQNFAGAVPLLEQAFKLDDRHPEVIKRLALAYVNLKMFDKAAPLAEDYTYLRPGDSEFVYVASYCLKKVKEYSRAADYGERLKLRNPRHVKNLINLAEVYAKMRNLARAELLLDSALLVDPDNTTARSRLEKVRRAA